MQFCPGIIRELKIKHLCFSNNNPRLNPGNLDELMMSIRENNVLQPLVVRPLKDHYEVVAGNRRLEACRRLGFRKIQCHVMELEDKEAIEISLIENIQRKTIHPFEEAVAFKKYVKKYGKGGVNELAKKIGKSPAYVSKRLRLLKLPEDIRKEISISIEGYGAAEELLKIKDTEKRRKLSKIIVSKKMTVVEARALIKMSRTLKNNEETIINSDDQFQLDDELRVCNQALRKVTAILRTSLISLDDVIEDVDNNWFLKETLMDQRRILHGLISSSLKTKKKINSPLGIKMLEINSISMPFIKVE